MLTKEKKTEPLVKGPFVGTIEDYPPELVHNEYIIKGYRCNYRSLCAVLMTIFDWHNETINIWSHLLGCIGFTAVLVQFTYYYPQEYEPQVEQVPVWPLWVHAASAVFCMGASGIYHCFQCFDEPTYRLTIKLDYVGVCVMIAGAPFPLTYYSYACRDTHLIRDIFLGLISFSGIFMSFSMMSDYHQRNDTFKQRAFMIFLFGVIVSAPFWFHGYFNVEDTVPLCTPLWYMGSALITTGAVIYGLRMPEKCKPGAYDHCG